MILRPEHTHLELLVPNSEQTENEGIERDHVSKRLRQPRGPILNYTRQSLLPQSERGEILVVNLRLLLLLDGALLLVLLDILHYPLLHQSEDAGKTTGIMFAVGIIRKEEKRQLPP